MVHWDRVAVRAMVLMAAFGPAVAHAGVYAPTAGSLLSEFGAVIKGNVTGGNDWEGPAIIGGNLNAPSTFFGKGITAGSTNSQGGNAGNPGLPTGFGTVNVYGAATGNYNLNPVNGTKQIVNVAGVNNANFGQGNKDVVLNNPWSAPVTFTTIFKTLTDLSTGLSGLTANNMIAPDGVFDAKPGKVNGIDGVAIFNLTGAELNKLTNIRVNTNGASTVVINVDVGAGGGFTQGDAVNFNHQGDDNSDRQNVLWNFFNATTNLSFKQWEGAVIAPLANVSNSSPIEGDVVAASASKGGEYHYNPFVGTLTFLSAVAVPEPASMGLLGLGLIAAGSVRLRRKA